MDIEIITTPNDHLKETGFGPYSTCHAIKHVLASKSHNINLTNCSSLSELENICNRNPDFIIAAVKYIYNDNNKIWLSEYFDNMSMNYTGSQKEGIDFDSDKILAKRKVTLEGIKTAEFFILHPGNHDFLSPVQMRFPFFVKPADAANGNGIDENSVIYSHAQYVNKVNSLFATYGSPVLVENYLGGREFTVALISLNNKSMIAAPVEILIPCEEGAYILGEETKKKNNEILVEIDEKDIFDRVVDIAKKSFFALNARDFARVDIRMDHHGTCNFLEINLIPGMKEETSYFPRAFKLNFKTKYSELIHLIIQGAISRIN